MRIIIVRFGRPIAACIKHGKNLPAILILLLTSNVIAAQDTSIEVITKHQYDLAGEGSSFLLNEAQKVSFFLLGELHGEQEIPQLMYSIWPAMISCGYRHIVAEISPWTAYQLEFGSDSAASKIKGL